MKNWKTLSKLKVKPFGKAQDKSEKLKVDDLITILLNNRGLNTNQETEEFLNPKLDRITPKNLKINEKKLKSSIARIKKAVETNEQIIIYGDYDVDGISGTAILWETLNSLGANVMPYIPHRTDEGYGLSKKGTDNLLKKYPETKIIITVDNGIVASAPVDYANSLGLEVIITDHHVPSQKLPNAYSIVHTTLICGAAVAWILSKEMLSVLSRRLSEESKSVVSLSVQLKRKQITGDHLGLVALATVADVMPLTGFNRTFVKLGLEQIRKTNRPGLLEMLKLAGVDQKKIGVYELGHIIGPRINATGRITHGIDSLRLICTPNGAKAKELARNLHVTNAKRQELTIESVAHAKGIANKNKKIIIISDKLYNPGIIGLISGRITEEYYRPSIVISETDGVSKGSARSVTGVNIIEFIRQAKELLMDAGGHKGAAGFTISTKNIKNFKKFLEDLAEKQIDEKLLIRKIKIDCELPIELINQKLFDSIQTLAPFGYGNPEPVFLARGVEIAGLYYVGKDGNHLKLQLKYQTRFDLEKTSNKGRTLNTPSTMGGIVFGFDQSLKFELGDRVDVVYSVYENEWNGNKKLELKIKEIAGSSK